MVSDLIRKRSFLPKIHIIHSDRGSIFKNEIVINFLISKNIQVSRGSSKAHLKDEIEPSRIKEGSELKFKKKKVVDPLTEFSVPIEEFEAIVKNVISSYNASAHSYFGVATTLFFDSK